MINEQCDFPDVDMLGLSDSIKPAFEKVDVTKEFTAINRRDPQTFEQFPIYCLPPLTRRYVIEKSKAIGQNPAGLALTLLAQGGALVGAAVKMRLENDFFIPPFLWVALICISGGGKSPILKGGFSLLIDTEERFYLEYVEKKKEYSRELKEYNQSQKRKHTGDTTQPPEDPPEEPIRKKVFLSSSVTLEGVYKDVRNNRKGALIFYDELSGLFSDIARNSKTGSADGWLGGYNGAPVNLSRKTVEEIFIPEAYWSIIGGITPETFRTVINSGNHLTDGTLSRFCLVYSPDVEDDEDADINDVTIDEFKHVIERLLSVDFQDDGKPLFVFPDESVKEHWRQWKKEIKTTFRKKDCDTEAAFISKSKETLPRVALILHLLKAAENIQYQESDCYLQDEIPIVIPPVLTLETWKEAETITRWIMRETWVCYCKLGFIIDTEQKEKDEKEVLEKIRKSEKPLTSNDIAIRFTKSRFRSDEAAKNRLKEALENLTERGEIVSEEIFNPKNRKTATFYKAK